MKSITKDVQALLEGMKTVTGQIDSLIMRCNELARAQGTEKKQRRANPKPLPRRSR